MSKLTKKRQILTATLAIALASAILINWYYNKNDVKKSSGSNTQSTASSNLGDSIYVNGTTKENSDNNASGENSGDGSTTSDEAKSVSKTKEYFAKAQLKRTQMHDEALDKIEALLKDGGKTDEAEKLMQEYTNAVKLETDIENLITAKTGADCLAILNGDQAEIVVDADAIDELYLLQITDIVSTQSKIPTENITIIQAK
ncbi:MAG: SpoIIIAH-like family protein [Acutalibacteraceae bacterium]|nr:SpoIIIAH-like family protein [Oscillospiraceae bacterium]